MSKIEDRTHSQSTPHLSEKMDNSSNSYNINYFSYLAVLNLLKTTCSFRIVLHLLVCNHQKLLVQANPKHYPTEKLWYLVSSLQDNNVLSMEIFKGSC